jgi:hypothetical protein
MIEKKISLRCCAALHPSPLPSLGSMSMALLLLVVLGDLHRTHANAIPAHDPHLESNSFLLEYYSNLSFLSFSF